jgi:hypothetical protein
MASIKGFNRLIPAIPSPDCQCAKMIIPTQKCPLQSLHSPRYTSVCIFTTRRCLPDHHEHPDRSSALSFFIRRDNGGVLPGVQSLHRR